MNLKEQLKGLYEKMQAAETVEEAEALQGQIDGVKGQIELAEKKRAAFRAMEADRPAEPKAEAPQTLGKAAAAAVKEAGYARGDRLHVSAKAATDPNVTPPIDGGYGSFHGVDHREGIVEGPRPKMALADLFGQETTDKGAVTYYVEGEDVDGKPTVVPEAGKYPQVHFPEPVSKTEPVVKIGCVYKDSDELLDDDARLAQSIDQRADHLMDVAEEQQFLSGDGKNGNVDGLLNRSGLLEATAADTAAALNQIKRAKVMIKKATGLDADAILVNPEDWDEITSLKDNNGRYLAGDPFNWPDQPRLFGLMAVESTELDPGQMVVGAYKMGGAVVRNGGRTVDVTNSDVDDFEHGLVAIRPSERAALLVRYPKAFCRITVGAKAAKAQAK